MLRDDDENFTDGSPSCGVHGSNYLRECGMCGEEFCARCYPGSTTCPTCTAQMEDEAEANARDENDQDRVDGGREEDEYFGDMEGDDLSADENGDFHDHDER